MKVLTLYTYDYYEWAEAIAVSLDSEKLERLYEKNKLDDVGLYCDSPLTLSEVEHRAFRQIEKAHYMIEDIEYLV